MKNLLVLALLFTSVFAIAQSDTKGIEITVTVDNVKNNTGKVIFALHSESTFMKTDPVQAAESTIKDNKVIVTFKNVPQGEYAILCVHDENNNNRMDFEDNGMPKEDYGSSNNPLSYGPPEFNTSKFTVKDKNLQLSIKF